MKSALHLDSLHLKVRGVPAATAAAAIRELGPALARELAAGTNAAVDAPAGRPLAVSRTVSVPALRGAIATHVAGALHPHLRSKP